MKAEHPIEIRAAKVVPLKPNVCISIISSDNGSSCRHGELLRRRAIGSVNLYTYGSQAQWEVRCSHDHQVQVRIQKATCANPMAQTSQRAKASSSKRRLEDVEADPASPPAKRKKTATARKSTGGKAPRPSEPEAHPQGSVMSSASFPSGLLCHR